MTTREDFTNDEWAVIRKTLHEPGVAMILASPGGALREFWAVARGVMEADDLFKESPFIQSLLSGNGAGSETPARPVAHGPQQFMNEMIADLRQARKIVESKATSEEAEDYKKLVTMLAERVAMAAKETKDGETNISDDEQRVLDEIQMALRRKI